MYLGLDYNFALGRQAELLRWAEDQRKIKQLRSNDPAEAVLVAGASMRADQDVAWPVEQKEPGERRAS